MSDTVAARQCPSELGGLVCRFFGTDRIVVNPLLRRIYYVGLAVIAVWAISTLVLSVGLALDRPGAGSIGFFIVAAFIGFSTAAWRIGCELVVAAMQVLVR